MGILPVDYIDPPSQFDRRSVWKAVAQPSPSAATTIVPTPSVNGTDDGSPQPVPPEYGPSRTGIIAASSLGGIVLLIVAFIFGAYYWRSKQDLKEAPSTAVRRMLGLETIPPDANGQQEGVQNANKLATTPVSPILALSRLPASQTLPAAEPPPSHPLTGLPIYPMAEPTTPTLAPSNDPPHGPPAANEVHSSKL